MESQEKQMIDGLLDRLQQAEEQTGARDGEAATHIAERIKAQPHAPYYMAQAMLIQEAALKKLQAQVSELERRLAQAEQHPASGNRGGFLAGLFGGGGSGAYSSAPSNAAGSASSGGSSYTPPPSAGPAPSRGSGFLGGALQTAAGVAGGIMVADMLTGMFHHSQPEEIVNVINEPGAAPMDAGFDNGGAGNFYDPGDTRWDAGAGNDYANTGYDDPGNGLGDGGWNDDGWSGGDNDDFV
ncbi:DUF2076 domain-containing protein [Salinisphaera hydrothermalis]|uniref:DUF2076 domain-containing protein n=1 Tax=Salinisphaera hydrothermalis TaxID=563188 RepID=UPI00333E8772